MRSTSKSALLHRSSFGFDLPPSFVLVSALFQTAGFALVAAREGHRHCAKSRRRGKISEPAIARACVSATDQGEATAGFIITSQATNEVIASLTFADSAQSVRTRQEEEEEDYNTLRSSFWFRSFCVFKRALPMAFFLGGMNPMTLQAG